MSLMVSISGIRGIFGSDLTPDNLTLYTSAFASWLGGGTVVVGRDSRTTGLICEKIVTAVLQSCGCNVVLLGIVPTPTVAMAVLQHRASGGIIISASHNPAEWNALKLLNGKSEFLDQKEGKQVMDIAQNREVQYKDYLSVGEALRDETSIESHIDAILDLPYIDRDSIRKARFRVVLDAVNGAGSIAIPRLLERLGVEEITKIHCNPNGLFPHNPEPLPEHLGEICEKVVASQSDLGFVTDPDADRLAIVDEKGALLGEEYTQALAFDFILRRNPGPVATNLSSSRVVDDIARKYGQKCYRSAVGEINVVKEMQRVNAVMGGEGNGGVINPDLHYGRDALVGVALTLQHLSEEKKTASQWRSEMPDYVISKSKIEMEGAESEAILDKVAGHFSNQDINTIDGVKIDFSEGWVHLRKSNTEPIIRIYSEAKDKKTANELVEKVKKAIHY